MPNKTVKKTTAKTTAAKKTVTKKTASAAKRPATKRVTKPVDVKDEIKIAAAPKCACGADCKCGENCTSVADCKCAREGSRFGRFMIKLIIVLIVFALGFGAAKLLDCNEFRGPRVDFDNGCLDASSVKCPRLQLALPAMDIDRDGCITREEYRAVKSEMHRQMRAEHRAMNRAPNGDR